ncbi:MAG: enamine deaminase RidA, partial [Acidimicrobiaceae bacterium]|nr:enamine deaminase RidA [Acidimicrobiaceae bacterium]
MINKIIQPDGWAPAKGYANGVLTRGKTLYIGGQIGWNSEKVFVSKDFIGQMEQVLNNIKKIVETAGGQVE